MAASTSANLSCLRLEKVAGSIITSAHLHIPHLNPPIPGYIALTILDLPPPQFWSDTIWAPANNVATLLLAPGQPSLAL